MQPTTPHPKNEENQSKEELRRLIRQIVLIRIPPYLVKERGEIVDKKLDIRNKLEEKLQKILRVQ